ncbi:MAG: biotin-dependent carboxyltransferase family protein, partial [Pseudomonadota bacterium]
TPGTAALELAGMGGRFEATAPLIIALTGGAMKATLDGDALAWHGSHAVAAGQTLEIGGAIAGAYGYLSVAGGFDTEVVLGSRASHAVAGIGGQVQPGTLLDVNPTSAQPDQVLDVENRFSGGEVRIVAGPQTGAFDPEDVARFEATEFQRDVRANRMGVRLISEGKGFHAKGGLSVLSEVIVPGDIQVTGDGTPFVLLPECQTTGGYPRIGSVIPVDMPKVAQAPGGSRVRFRFVTLDEAVTAERAFRAHIDGLKGKVRSRVRRPEDIADLLQYNLISGVTAGQEEDGSWG